MAIGRCPVLLHIEHWALALVADICRLEITGGAVSRLPTTTTASLEELVGGVEVGTPVLLLRLDVVSDDIPVQVFQPGEGSRTEVRRDLELRCPPVPVHLLQLRGNRAWVCRWHFGGCPCWRCPFHTIFGLIVPVFFRIMASPHFWPLHPWHVLASPRARGSVGVVVGCFLPWSVVIRWAVRRPVTRPWIVIRSCRWPGWRRGLRGIWRLPCWLRLLSSCRRRAWLSRRRLLRRRRGPPWRLPCFW